MIRVEDKQLQTDLDSLLKWSHDLQMTFNTDKCKVMHIGGRNQPCVDYYMEGHKLGKCHEEKDLGIIVSDDLKVGTHCNQAFSNAQYIEAEQNSSDNGQSVQDDDSAARVPAWSPYYMQRERNVVS